MIISKSYAKFYYLKDHTKKKKNSKTNASIKNIIHSLSKPKLRYRIE